MECWRCADVTLPPMRSPEDRLRQPGESGGVGFVEQPTKPAAIVVPTALIKRHF